MVDWSWTQQWDDTCCGSSRNTNSFDAHRSESKACSDNNWIHTTKKTKTFHPLREKSCSRASADCDGNDICMYSLLSGWIHFLLGIHCVALKYTIHCHTLTWFYHLKEDFYFGKVNNFTTLVQMEISQHLLDGLIQAFMVSRVFGDQVFTPVKYFNAFDGF